jgi:hypothetical protein
MKSHTECTKFTPALGKATAVLMAVFLASLSTGAAAQTGGPYPPATAAPEKIHLKMRGAQGDYELSASDKSTQAGLPKGKHPTGTFRCRWVEGGIDCR